MDHLFARVDNAVAILTGKEVQHGKAKYERDQRMKQAAAERKRNTKSKKVQARWDGLMDGSLSKAMDKLERRTQDYARMVADQKFKANEGAFHKPGSMQGPR